MSIRNSYTHTKYASYIGYVTQAIINNFPPLLFVYFSNNYSLPLSQISLIVALNFAVQIAVDLIGAAVIDKIGYRPCVIFAHLMSGVGLIMLGILPNTLQNPYVGIIIATVCSAIGGGLLEVIISPIIEACPFKNKRSAMSFLHSFYCWGHVFVVLGSTAFFVFVGIDSWIWLAMAWAAIPLLNAVYFALVPIHELDSSAPDGEPKRAGGFLKTRIFWLFMLLMLCAGASELAMSQWASAFAETGLGVSKTVGDLMGPCMFAILMGTARVLYAKISEKLGATRYMCLCCGLCVVGYLLAALSPHPALGLVGCGLCGYAVGAMWPGTYTMAAQKCYGGTALFALLAFAGDIGCSLGPSVIGVVADLNGGQLQYGMLVATVFPIILALGTLALGKRKE
ncbi:MAG: MFS transporter [Clostridia bacterium]|nr:MFS transporter [Clostridia bacterium]